MSEVHTTLVIKSRVVAVATLIGYSIKIVRGGSSFANGYIPWILRVVGRTLGVDVS